MAEERDLTLQEPGSEVIQPYPLLRQQGQQNILELIEENLGGQNFSVLNFPRIQMPSGGALIFREQTLSGEANDRELEGIMIAWRPARIFYREKFGGGRKPPDCTSKDGLVGIGDPGGRCSDCHYAQFGTATDTNGKPASGQACKEIRQILLLRPDEILPHLLSVPPTSLKAFMQYSMHLLSARIPYWGVVSKLTLEKANNEGGIAYARIVFQLGKRLSNAEQSALYPYHRRMKEILVPSVIDASDYVVQDDTLK